jgi:hypothetical protein
MPSNVNGFGTKYYGQRDFRADGSYITTNFFCLASTASLRSLGGQSDS